MAEPWGSFSLARNSKPLLLMLMVCPIPAMTGPERRVVLYSRSNWIG